MPLTVSDSERSELAVTYAALILNDDSVPITEENLNKVIAAAKITVEPYWPKLFSTMLKGRDVNDLLLSAGAAGPAAGGAAPAAAAAGGAAPAAAAAAAAPAKKESSSSESVGGAGGLFGDDSD